jgi:hypothetical protein
LVSKIGMIIKYKKFSHHPKKGWKHRMNAQAYFGKNMVEGSVERQRV